MLPFFSNTTSKSVSVSSFQGSPAIPLSFFFFFFLLSAGSSMTGCSTFFLDFIFFFAEALGSSLMGMYSGASTLTGFFLLPFLGLLSMDREGLEWPGRVSSSWWIFFSSSPSRCVLWGSSASVSAPRLPVPHPSFPLSKCLQHPWPPWPRRTKGPGLRGLWDPGPPFSPSCVF
ncbi:hypothetical protein H8958_017477 [Nasalis larvatus]